jgi:hypothetical protein
MTTLNIFPVLKQGSTAYYDSIVGPIPCKIDTISSEHPTNLRPSSDQNVCATVTKDTGAFKKGYTLTGWGLDFFPRDALRRTQFSSYIKPYQVQA